MSSDDKLRPSDTTWRAPGIGLNIPRTCLGCNTGRQIKGGRGIGVRWRCAACLMKGKQ